MKTENVYVKPIEKDFIDEKPKKIVFIHRQKPELKIIIGETIEIDLFHG